ncbi:hypothetical protein X798_07715 [Onchocerca flexuosa]|uniref:Ovule protein n=2 Tax=Onchocerca flexuosa TaxID=387005 RepID=A0A183GXP8_9BILA|nr:hypothetical protein X798_07715 [Onchocerca flexuosa]VDO24184.1 unnamed protein product [Onchocerca flexuosa]
MPPKSNGLERTYWISCSWGLKRYLSSVSYSWGHDLNICTPPQHETHTPREYECNYYHKHLMNGSERIVGKICIFGEGSPG